MSETITFRVYVRVGSNGETTSITQLEMDAGTTLDEVWGEDGDVSFRDHVIEVTTPLPPALEDAAPDAFVTLAEPVPAHLEVAESS